MKKTFNDYEDLQAFVEPLMSEEKWFIDIRQVSEEEYSVEWREHKKYKSYPDGTEYRDEIWLTEDMRAIFIQDLDEEHCKNILRMILRKDREKEQLVVQLKNSMESGEFDLSKLIPGIDEQVDNLFPKGTDTDFKPTLH